MIITKPNIFGDQIQKSIAIELIIGYRKLIKPLQSLPSIRTCSTRMHLPKPILQQYIPTLGSRQTLFSQATSLRKKACASKSQVDHLMQRVIRRAEKNMPPMRSHSNALFGRVLAPLEPGSHAVTLEQNQESERRRYYNPTMRLIRLVQHIGKSLAVRFGGRNCSRDGRVARICNRR